MNRRESLLLLGAATTDLAALSLLAILDGDEQERVARAIVAPQRVDGQTISHIETVLHSAMYHDDALGPQAALDTVLAQRTLARTLLTECPSDLQRRLLTLYSNLSRFAGWLSFDLGNFETAIYYYEQARLAAYEARNTELGIFVLCNMSHLATWRGQPRVGIDHAMAAQYWAKDTDDHLLCAYIADVAARAYAGADQQRACQEALDTAQAGVTDVPMQTPATSLVYFYGPGQLASTRSQCLLQLDNAEQAEQAAKYSLELVGSSFVRNRAFSTIGLGKAHIAAGDIDEAARVIGEGAALAIRNRSTRVIDRLSRARASMQAWQYTPAVKELDDKLIAYGLVSNART